MNLTDKKKYYSLILILGLLAGIMPLSIDMYLPGFPSMAAALRTDVASVGISLAGFFIGVCTGQLLYGPLMDKYGRKKPLVAGLIIYIAASLACAFAPSLAWLVVLRFVQALGGCAAYVANRAIARDLFSDAEIVKVFSLLMLVTGVAPIVAPSIGSLVVAAYDWKGVFFLLALIAALLMGCVYFFLPETKKENRSLSLHPKQVLAGYYTVLKNPVFLFYTLAFSFASAGMFAYITGSAFVFMKLHGLSEQQYGLAFGFNASCLIAGSQLNRYFILHKTSEQIVKLAGTFLVVITLALGVLTIAGVDSFALMLMCLSGYLFFNGIINPNATALALQPFSKNAGVASALSGFSQMAVSAVSSITVSYFANGTALPMVCVILFCALGCLAAVLIAEWIRKHKPERKVVLQH
jgi:DHA1 family bicyclomycin/chloramphenicol resistance-like MFS transporter